MQFPSSYSQDRKDFSQPEKPFQGRLSYVTRENKQEIRKPQEKQPLFSVNPYCNQFPESSRRFYEREQEFSNEFYGNNYVNNNNYVNHSGPSVAYRTPVFYPNAPRHASGDYFKNDYNPNRNHYDFPPRLPQPPPLYSNPKKPYIKELFSIDYGHGKLEESKEKQTNQTKNEKVTKEKLSKEMEIELLNKKNPIKSSSKEKSVVRSKSEEEISSKLRRKTDEKVSDDETTSIKLCIRCKPYEHSTLSLDPILREVPMQRRLSRHFEKFADIIDESLSTIDGDKCHEKHKIIFNHVKNILHFDKCYEQCMWDFDIKFMFDYLPGTKRGKDNLVDFVYGQTYEEEDNKWRRYEVILKKQHDKEVERLSKLSSLKPKSKLNTGEMIEKNIDFPEDNITDEFCGLCNDTFTSVLASMSHYESAKHTERVNNYFIEKLLTVDIIKPSDVTYKTTLLDSTVRRYVKKFKTKPTEWICELCNVRLTSEDHGVTHFSGANHKAKAIGALSGEKLCEAAYVDKIDESDEMFGEDEDILPAPPPSKKLRAAPVAVQNNNCFIGKNRNKSSYVGHFGKKGGYSGYFGR